MKLRTINRVKDINAKSELDLTTINIRKILNKVWKKEIKLDPLTLAVYYVYNFNLSYGPGFMGPGGRTPPCSRPGPLH